MLILGRCGLLELLQRPLHPGRPGDRRPEQRHIELSQRPQGTYLHIAGLG